MSTTSATTVRALAEPFAIAGFVVAVVGVLLANALPIAGVVAGGVAVALAAVGLRRSARAGLRGRLAVAGLVIGIVAVGGAVLDSAFAAAPVTQLLDLVG